MTARCRAAVVGAAAAALLLGLTAPPAAAGPDDLVVTVDRPDDGAVLGDPSVTVSGTVDSRPGLNLLNAAIDRIVVRLEPEGDGAPVEVEVCRSCGGTPRPFSATVTLPRNGRYQATATAEGKGQLLGLGLTAVGGRGSRPFGLNARPRPPADVKVDVSPDRVVTVSWARNPEPDVLHYRASRKTGGGDFSKPQVISHPDSGRVSFVDTGAAAGGDFVYRVVAVRTGADGPVDSGSTDTRSVSVPAPAVAADPAAPGAAPGAAGTGDPAAAGGPPRLDVSAFLATRPGPALPTPVREIELPDTGFSRDLPFGARPPGEELEEGDLEAEPRSLEVGSATTEFVSRGRPLVPVAGGAVLLLLAVHLRLLNRRVNAVPAAVIGGDGTDLTHLDPATDPVPDPAVDPGPEPEAGPAAAPTPVLFDYEDVAPPPPADDPVDDGIWSEDDWDDEHVREFVSPAR